MSRQTTDAASRGWKPFGEPTPTVDGDLWWRAPYRMFQTNLREIDAGLDVARVLDYIQEFGAGAWLVSVGGIISNYPTLLSFQSRNPMLAQRASGDLIGDAVKASHERGIRLMARMDFSKVPWRVAEEHPEWCFISFNGEQQVYNSYVSVCPNGEYYQQKVFEILSEVVGNYEVDGFFFNWMTFNEIDYEKRYRGVCQCHSCHAAFAAFAPDVELPVGPESPDYTLWRRFTAGVLDDLVSRFRGHIARLRPEAPLMMEEPSADIVFHEANHYIGNSLWHHFTGAGVSVAKSFRPNTPVLVNSVAYIDVPYRFAGEEPHRFAQYLVQAISRGANPSTYIMGTPDDVEYESLLVAAEITRFHRDQDETYRGLQPAARTALVRVDPLKADERRAEEATEEFRGLYSAFLERHVPFDVLAEERIAELHESGDLARYALLVLPDLGPLAEQTVAALDRFVGAGGRLLTTGSSGMDVAKVQLECLGIDSRVAVRETRELTWSSHLRHEPNSDGSLGYPVPVVGAYHVVTVKDDAEAAMHMLSRALYGPPEKCYGHFDIAEQRGYVSRDYQAGRSTVIPWTVGRGYSEEGLSALRDIPVDRAIELLGDDLEIVTALPEQVEIVMGRSEAGTVIHLINYSGIRPRRFIAPLTIPGARISFPGSRHDLRVVALRSGDDLEVTVVDGIPGVECPAIELFEVLVVS